MNSDQKPYFPPSGQRHLNDGRQFNIGADVISYLMPDRYPLIMVDRVTDFKTSPLCLTAERYVSANEPVFKGHFPDFKLWPGIYTLEGLRQSCHLLQILKHVDDNALIEGVIELQNQFTLKPKIDKTSYKRLLDFLKEIEHPDPFLFTLRVKLITPVFAGCIIKYFVVHNLQNKDDWSVEAEVNGRTIAKGIIIF